MYFSINDHMVSEFFSGLIPIFALVVIGYLFSILLGGMARRFPFSRLALIVVLPPLSLVRFLDPKSSFVLYLYAVVVMILGIVIDGIGYLQEPKEAQVKAVSKEEPEETDAAVEPDPNVIIWEKAE